MNVVVVVGAALATALAFITYILFQRTTMNFSVDIFINSEPREVFNFVKDPKNLPDIDHRTKSTEVQRIIVNPDGVEHREYISQEEFRHVGLQKVSTWSTCNPDLLVIHHSTMTLYSLIQSHSVFNFKPYQHHGRQGTLVSEHIDIVIPYALLSFVNKTVLVAHKDMMQNLKFILERTYNTDKDLNDEFEHKLEATKDVVEEHQEDNLQNRKLENAEYDEEDSWDLFHKG